MCIALLEDIGDGDVTAQLILEKERSNAAIVAREQAIICGCDFVSEVFRQLDDTVNLDWKVKDGQSVESDETLCELQGSSRSLLTGERTALNFLQTLSGTATQTHLFVEAISKHPAKLLDTRKTIPGLRFAQKYAVICGGGYNHRIGLFDAFLIKENHIAASGGIAQAVVSAQKLAPDLLLEVEVETFEQLDEAVASGVNRILLDNFTLEKMRSAVNRVGDKVELEASGNITLETILAVAKTGVDYISTGSITKHVTAIDLSMRFKD